MNKPTILSKLIISKTSHYTLHFTALFSTTPPNTHTTFITSLQQCSVTKTLSKGQILHAQLVTTALINTSPSITTSLINMYSKCHQMDQASLVLSMTLPHNRNVFVYNAMISGFVSNGFVKQGLDSYKEMRKKNVFPDTATFPSLIKGVCEFLRFNEMFMIHCLVIKFGLELNAFVASALVCSFMKMELMNEARKVFDEMREKDVVLWNSVVNGYAQNGLYSEAMSSFRRMNREGVFVSGFTVTGVLSACSVMGDLDNGKLVHGLVIKLGFDSVVSVCNALIDMYGKCKSFGNAFDVFERIHDKDVFSWNSILHVSELCGDHSGTLRYFHAMLADGIMPDLITITTIIPACSHLAALRHGREIHSYMIINGFASEGDYILIDNALMDMYTKCGSMRDAYMLFHKISCKDVVSWNIMILGCGKHGYANEALDMFSHMLDARLKPTQVTFVGILSACSHAGNVNQGREIIQKMESDYGIVPTIEHYACIIDMLGRAGQLDEAYQMASTMPINANAVIWRTLLAACQLHRNADLAKIAAKQVLELEPWHCGNYVLLSNVNVAAGCYDEVLDIRNTMKQQNVKKLPGCSWVDLKDGLHSFINCDWSHPESESVYSQLDSLVAHMCEPEYV